ncbi:S1/P1 nuclease [Roseiconus lacunae]|uniref:S1/P1 nuclease n=1 Tax=Roseiconus lacunae TaxID=2605694 RepID=UPI003092D4F8|nr:S1/P1 nuclease [Stieleria sp. HD01]
MLQFLPVFAAILLPSTALAWSASGHHVVAVAAYDMLEDEVRSEVIEILSHHPDFQTRFTPGDERWQIGVAGTWPDLIRRSPEDRPQWHYQLGANMVVGNVTPDEPPGPLPPTATMDTKDLYIVQAIKLAFRVYADETKPKSERAIALCWLCHLVGDSHQPCHAGSLYAPCFNGHDRGANSIRLSGGGNLHSAWDRLLGSRATANDVRRRVAQLEIDEAAMDRNAQEIGSRYVEPLLWIEESREAAQRYVYTPDVLVPVRAASRDGGRLDTLRLHESYFEDAGQVARERAKFAAHRLAIVLTNGIEQQ